MINVLEMESSKGWGGQEKRTVRLVNHLNEERYKVFWAVEEESKLYRKRQDIKGHFFTFKLNRIYNLKTLWKLCLLVKKHHIDIISTHSGKDAWIGNIVGLLMRRKVVRVRHLIVPIKSAASYNLADKVVTVSHQVKSYLESAGVKENKLVNIYTGIDTDKFMDKTDYDLRAELNVEKDTLLVGIVAVLRRAKRHKELIETFMRLNMKVKLIIVGEGPQSQNISKIIEKNNLQDRVIMLGHREDIEKILPNFDLFVLPSMHEALGTSLLEAQSCGVPVLAFNTGGIPEALSQGKTGYLFDNFKILEEQLESVLTDKVKLNFFKQNTRPFILEKFSVEKMLHDTEILYDNLVKE